jgi:phosphoglycerol transferase MdoB-like AlkP superfamily enzyme
MPGKLKGNINFPTQQVDIMPTVLSLCGYQGNAAAFGRNILTQDSASAKSFAWINNNYLLMDNQLTIKNNGTKLIAAYDYKNDKACVENVLMSKGKEAEKLNPYLKAVMQTYNEALLKNRFFPTK